MPLHIFGWELRRPGQLALPILLTFFIFSLSLKPWKWNDRYARFFLLGLFLFFLIWTFHPHTGSDGSFYYANLRSLWLDGDLNFYEEYRHEMGEAYLGSLNPKTGYTYNGFSVGPAFLWSPVFGLAHLWCSLESRLGVGYALNGHDPPYLYLVCLCTALFGLAGASVCYRFFRRWTGPGASALSVALIVFGSPVVYYMFQESTMSHAMGFFLGSSVVVWWWKRYQAEIASPDEEPTYGRAGAFGLLIGLAMLVRWQSGILFIFPLFDFIRQLLNLRGEVENRGVKTKKLVLSYCVLVIFWLIAVFPQLAVWKGQVGAWYHLPQGRGYLQNWTSPEIFKVLFSPLHGLFTWHPALLVATLCMPFLWKKHRAFLIRAAVVLLLQLYINAVVVDWWAGGSFGQRRFSASLILWGLPLALGIERLFILACTIRRGTVIRHAAVVLVCFLILSNFLLMAQFLHGPIGHMGELHWGQYFSRWLWEQPNVFDTLQSVFLYMPLLNGLVFGLRHGDAGLLFPAFFLIMLMMLSGMMVLKPSFLLGRRPTVNAQRKWVQWLSVLLVAFSLFILWSGSNVTTLLIINNKPETVPLGNVRRLVVGRQHRYTGGFYEKRLAPGQSDEFTPDLPLQAGSAILSSFIGGPITPPPGEIIGRLSLVDSAGQTTVLDIRSREHTASSQALGLLADRTPGTGLPPSARKWMPNQKAPFAFSSWYAEWPFEQFRDIERIRIENTSTQFPLIIEGLAFRPLPGNTLHSSLARQANRCIPISFQSLCNAAWDHNPFAPYENRTYSHFKFPELTLYNGAVPLNIYPPYEKTKKWNALTTCDQDGRSYQIALYPPSPMEKLHVAYASGLIRSPEADNIADLILVHQSGGRQIYRFRANREAFEYLAGYRPSHKVLQGGRTSYMYDGRVSVVEIPVLSPHDPIQSIEIVDANGPGKAGITLLAMTAVGRKAYAEGHRTQPETASPEFSGDFKAFQANRNKGEILVAEEEGFLWAVPFGGGPRRQLICPRGPITSVAYQEKKNNFYLLYEDGTVFSSDPGAHRGNGAVPAGLRAVDLEIDRSGEGYHILLSDGSVQSLSAPFFPQWTGDVRGSFIAFDLEPRGRYWLGLTNRGAVYAAGSKPDFNPGNAPRWNWNIARDIAATENGAYILDGFGGLHPIGKEKKKVFPGYREEDIYTAIEDLGSDGLVILEKNGTVHRMK